MEKWDASSVKKPGPDSEEQPELPASQHTEPASCLADAIRMQALAIEKQTQAIMNLCEELELLTTQNSIILDILTPAAEEELEENETPQYLNQRTRSQ